MMNVQENIKQGKTKNKRSRGGNKQVSFKNEQNEAASFLPASSSKVVRGASQTAKR